MANALSIPAKIIVIAKDWEMFTEMKERWMLEDCPGYHIGGAGVNTAG
jgi:hypothetical protein